jgi:predicted  nucleic acid-binding Zn-ribbon protein
MAENNQQEMQQPQKRKKVPAGIWVILILLLGLLGFISWLYLDQKQTTNEITQALSAEKDSLKSELVELRNEYDSLKTSNDSINIQLEQEQERIDNLISELKNVKATNYTRIRQLKKELETVRNIAKSYVRQIDSLNQLNQQLIAENRKVKQDLEQTQETKKKLEEEREDLKEQVNKAKVLRTENERAVPINKRGKEKDQVDKIDKIKICFSIEENVLVEPGKRPVYIRIASPPDDFILTNSEKNLFEYQGKQIVYSAKREIDYTGEQQDMCIYFDTQGQLKPGEYEVYIFADGHQIGQTSFILEESGWLFF